MAGITATTGLVSGIATQDTIDKLMQIAARPRDLLISRNKEAQTEQAALSQVQAMILAMQVNVQKLTKSDTFNKTKATSSDDSIMTALTTGSPTAGSYSFRAVRLAQSQQLISGPFASNTQAIGAGTVSFRFGGYINDGIALSQLNGGSGVQAGAIRITDRSGTSAEIDLSYAQTIDDVLNAINSTKTINVQAVTSGDRIKLLDQTGQTLSNLRVQEVNGGTTAASLGLSAINTASNSATGQDVLSLSNSFGLTSFRNGTGLSLRDALPDLRVSFRDGSSDLDVDFDSEKTLGEMLETINAADPTRLQAQLSADGDRLEFLDLTTDTGGTFAISSPMGGELAEELGLTGTAVDGKLTSGRLMAGLKTALASTLRGGAGLGTLGQISLTDRSGATATVDLSGAETLDEILTRLNASGIGITAKYNTARNGIELADTTGATTSNLIIANADATNSADQLQIAANVSRSQVNSGSLKMQVVSESTSLASLNGGKGVFRSSILLNDSNGNFGTLRMLDQSIQTVGDVIDAINNLGIGIQARINDGGDGIALVDTANGGSTMRVREVGSGRAAADLRILGEGSNITVDGSSAVGIDGSTAFTVTLSATDTLQDLTTKINALNSGVNAGILNMGSGATPYRLSLASQRSGVAGNLLIDTSNVSFSLSETTRGQDALVAVNPTDLSPGIVVSSNTNDFDNVVSGLRMTLKSASSSVVNVTVERNTTDVMDTAKRFADDFNKMRGELDDQLKFDADANNRGPLFGSVELLQVESEFGNLLTSRISGAGSFRSLEELGFSLDRQGKIQLNEQKLKDQLAVNPDQVRNFFTSEKTGAAVRINDLINRLAGVPTVNGRPSGKSIFDKRQQTIQDRINLTQERIDLLTVRLTAQRELLSKQFNAMETALAKMQSTQTALSQLEQLASAFGGGK